MIILSKQYKLNHPLIVNQSKILDKLIYKHTKEIMKGSNDNGYSNPIEKISDGDEIHLQA